MELCERTAIAFLEVAWGKLESALLALGDEHIRFGDIQRIKQEIGDEILSLKIGI